MRAVALPHAPDLARARVHARALLKAARRQSKELLLTPILICRNENESCLVETSINAVRVSIRLKKADELEEVLCSMLMRFLMQRAEEFVILRRRPIDASTAAAAVAAAGAGVGAAAAAGRAAGGEPAAVDAADVDVHVAESARSFDISFLVTNFHLERMWQQKLVDFIIQFLEDVNKEVSAMKIAVNARARIVASEFMREFVA